MSTNSPTTSLIQRSFNVPQLIGAMLKARDHVSDLIFSPGRAPQVEVSGQLVELKFKGLECLVPGDTDQIAKFLVGKNQHAALKLEQDGSADLSYGLENTARFRVNIFRQRGTCAIVMRVIPDRIPSFEDLKLPPHLQEICGIRNGIVLVTGPTGSGKSSTLAAIIDKMNEEKAIHILTIEDPIEFLHRHKKATIHQRELHSDTPTFAAALRGALRQAPKVILVGEMRDRETIEIALEASETGHLVLSTLHTIDAAKTVERIIGAFPMEDQQGMRNRLAKAFRYILSKRARAKARRFSTPCATAPPKACSFSTAKLKSSSAPASSILKPASPTPPIPATCGSNSPTSSTATKNPNPPPAANPNSNSPHNQTPVAAAFRGGPLLIWPFFLSAGAKLPLLRTKPHHATYAAPHPAHESLFSPLLFSHPQTYDGPSSVPRLRPHFAHDLCA